MTDDDIMAEMCRFPRAVQAVSESLHSRFPAIKRSAIVDRIHALADAGLVVKTGAATRTGRATLVERSK